MSNVTDAAINVYIQNPDTINWIKDLILPIIGVLIGAILSFCFNQANEKRFLGWKIELNIAEELLILIKMPHTLLLFFDLKERLDYINSINEAGTYVDVNDKIKDTKNARTKDTTLR